MVEMGHFQYSMGNNSKSMKTRVTVHVFACHLMVFNICVKFHENMSSRFKVMELTKILLSDTHTHTNTEKTKSYILHCIAYFVNYCSCVLHVLP